MENLRIYKAETLIPYLKCRDEENKIGQTISFVKSLEDLNTNKAKYVLIGIPEDIGVRANLGRGGSYGAWELALSSFLNTQENEYNTGKDVILLGHLDFSKLMQKAEELNSNKHKDLKTLRELTSQIDKEVSELIEKVTKSNKIPIVIGGGHNNAFGILKGSSKAIGTPLNAINFDAHTDLRPLEGRHSGNGFSYAIKKEYLDRYFIFGLHENYTPSAIFDYIKSSKKIDYNTYEELMIRKEKDFNREILSALRMIGKSKFGIEIDLDAIQNFPSSAMTPSGFTAAKSRRFIHQVANHKNVAYLHICEGAPKYGLEQNKEQMGKMISFLISDFLRSRRQ